MDRLAQLNIRKQTYIDTLFEYQCCIATLVEEMKDLEQIGSNCAEEEFQKIAEVNLMLETLLCWDSTTTNNCLTEDEIKAILMYLKRLCKNCCTDDKIFVKYPLPPQIIK